MKMTEKSKAALMTLLKGKKGETATPARGPKRGFAALGSTSK